MYFTYKIDEKNKDDSLHAKIFYYKDAKNFSSLIFLTDFPNLKI